MGSVEAAKIGALLLEDPRHWLLAAVGAAAVPAAAGVTVDVAIVPWVRPDRTVVFRCALSLYELCPPGQAQPEGRE